MRHGKASTVTALPLAFCALILTACDAQKQVREKSDSTAITRVAVSQHSLDEPMNYTRGLMLEKLMRQRPGMNLSFVEAGGNAQTQAVQIQTLLAEKPSVLVVFPEEIEPLSDLLSSALHHGTKVVVIGREASPQLCTTCIFVDEKKIGLVAGNFVVSALKKKSEDERQPQVTGRVLQLTGQEQSRVTRERSDGFVQALAAEPDITLVHDAPTNWDASTIKARLSEAQQLQKSFDVIFAHSDLIARTAHLALTEQNAAQREHVLVLGVDGQPGTGGGTQMIISAEMDATVFNPPLVDLAWKIIRRMLDDPGYQPKPRYEVEPFIITTEKAFDLARTDVPAPEP